MYILGISAFFHDSAACLLRDGVIAAAAQEERFTRRKQDAGFPAHAIEACLRQEGITFDDVDYVGFYEKTHLKFERIIRNYANFHPRGYDTFQHAIPNWLKSKLWQPGYIKSRLVDLSPTRGASMRWDGRLIFCEHHFSHAASAFYPSPFRDAAIVTLDGVGEFCTTSLAAGSTDDRGVPRVDFISEIRYPDSLGMLYAAVTAYLGFKVNSGEYKVMGLAPYGTPKYASLMLEKLIDLRDDGSFRLNMEYFSFPYSNEMVTPAFWRLFDLEPRKSEGRLTQKHFDIAASIQEVCNVAVRRIGEHVHRVTGSRNLCMAGGVALNCVANGLLWRDGPFTDIWIQPAAGDAGGAVGVAQYIWHDVLGERKSLTAQGRDLMQGAYLGPSFSAEEIRLAIEKRNLKYTCLEDEQVPEIVADYLTREWIVGWFQGRMEFGPRALGARSILGDPRSPGMQKTMNLKIKYRESFRPFAPSVVRERVGEWFYLSGKTGSMLGGNDGAGYDSPYMLLVAPVRDEHTTPMTEEQQRLFGIDKLNVPRSSIPACTHVDYSARIQTVDGETNPRYHKLIDEFGRRTGVPMVVNTSFNVRGEPIVCSPDDALNCFLGTDIDVLVLENFVLLKSDVPESMKLDYKNRFALD